MPQHERDSRADERELLRRWLETEDQFEAGLVNDEQYQVMEDAVCDAFGPEASFVLADHLRDVSSGRSLADLAADPARLRLLLDAVLAARPDGWLERRKSWPTLPTCEYHWSADEEGQNPDELENNGGPKRT